MSTHGQDELPTCPIESGHVLETSYVQLVLYSLPMSMFMFLTPLGSRYFFLTSKLSIFSYRKRGSPCVTC